MQGPLPRKLESYPMRLTERLRYGDTDRQGHVNNAVYATLSESGRVHFLFDPDNPVTPTGTDFVIVKLTIVFRRELLWPGTVEIGTGVARIGGKSITLEQGMFCNGEAVATAENVMAIMDARTRRAIEIPPMTLKRLEDWMLPPM